MEELGTARQLRRTPGRRRRRSTASVLDPYSDMAPFHGELLPRLPPGRLLSSGLHLPSELPLLGNTMGNNLNLNICSDMAAFDDFLHLSDTLNERPPPNDNISVSPGPSRNGSGNGPDNNTARSFPLSYGWTYL
eukprot:TRINITY_DN33229_c0_g1_i1.p1 TRINITY_DN33229_c0_g1~~TRINITY_DN33229_c0_g1_i1.p1  ORF type:complete len:134 (-),score=3.49 TRINITY_DN33229_c0_g1_i1:847-1248(-)